jgi:hypothetical protein
MARKRSAARRKRMTLTEAPAGTRKAILTGIRGLLRKHGVDGQVVELQVKPKAAARKRRAAAPRRVGAARAAAAPAPGPPPCPTGTVRRVVCFFRKGTFVCEERCVPV